MLGKYLLYKFIKIANIHAFGLPITIQIYHEVELF